MTNRDIRHTTAGELTPTPPFDFQKSLDFLNIFTPTADEQSMAAQQLTKGVRIDGQNVAFRVEAVGSTDGPRLRYRLFADEPIDARVEAGVVDLITNFLSLSDDLQPFYALAEDDPIFAPIVEQFYGYHQVKFMTPFENACWAILSTRTRMATARKWKAQLIDTFGGNVTVDGETYPAFPEPADVHAVPLKQLQAIISYGRKAEYIRNAAAAFSEVDDTWLRAGNYDDVHDWLLDITGIGPWSAAFIMMRALGRMGRLTSPETRLVQIASRLYGRTLTADDVQALAAAYGDYQGYWAHYLRAFGELHLERQGVIT